MLMDAVNIICLKCICQSTEKVQCLLVWTDGVAGLTFSSSEKSSPRTVVTQWLDVLSSGLEVFTGFSAKYYCLHSSVFIIVTTIISWIIHLRIIVTTVQSSLLSPPSSLLSPPSSAESFIQVLLSAQFSLHYYPHHLPYYHHHRQLNHSSKYYCHHSSVFILTTTIISSVIHPSITITTVQSGGSDLVFFHELAVSYFQWKGSDQCHIDVFCFVFCYLIGSNSITLTILLPCDWLYY